MWPGDYSAYVVARQLELERQQQQYVTQQKEIARLEEAVRRFRHWAHIRVNERAAQAGARQADADRPHGEGRAAGLRAPPDGARAAHRLARRPARARARGRRRQLRRRARPARRRARRHARRARRRRRPQRRRQDDAAADPRRGARARRRARAGRGDGITLGYLSPGRGRAARRRDRARRPARRPLDGRGHRRAAADGLPVRLRAVPAARSARCPAASARGSRSCA